MSRLHWDDRYRVGVHAIDSQHRGLFDLYNELYQSVVDGADRAVLLSVVDRLMRYCAVHFGEEERYMRAYAHEGYLAHRHAHLRFNETVQQFRQRAEEGDELPATPLLGMLRQWIDSHTLSMDQDLGRFLAERGVSHA